MKKVSVLALLLVVFLAVSASAQRLPDNAYPEHYSLTFYPDLKAAKFSGEEAIDVVLKRPSATLTLNSLELEYQAVMAHIGKKTLTATVSTDPQKEMATFTFPEPLPAGKVLIHIHFTGTLNEKLAGFYLSRGEGRNYAVTQFEATDARRAFPSFDEPAMKATFAIKLVVDKGDTALSNGRIISDKPGPGADKHTLTFSTTPKMSSYLVAMAVGDFKCSSGGVDGIPIRVCSTPDKVHLTTFAVKATEEAVHFFNNYYRVKYPFGKLDVLGVPDFSAGAMENTGLITSRERILLIDDAKDSVGMHRLVADVLAHEIAHQWFGDLVTAQWWDNIWLNEGFATWASANPAKSWKPEWNSQMDEVQDTNNSLSVDSAVNTRSIRSKAETRREIGEQFDGISYGKAAAVLRMVESYVGKETFRTGVTNYLKQHSYGNATAEDFWGAITQASGKPVDKIMKTFVDQPGAPVINVAAKCTTQGETAVTLSQRRFYYDRKRLEAGGPELWNVPVCLRPAGSAQPARCELLTQEEQTFTLPGCAPWVFANAGSQGYYRSAYSPEAVGQMAASVEKDLTPAERITLLGDEWAQVRAGQHDIGDFLKLAEGLKGDRERAVMEVLAARVRDISNGLTTDADRGAYQAWVRNLLRPAAAELGWAPAASESSERNLLRGSVLFTLGSAGEDPQVLEQARALVVKRLKDGAPADPTVLENAVRLAAIHGDAALYDQYLEQSRKAQVPEERYLYQEALSRFQDPALIQRTLEYSISPEVRTQDAGRMLGAMYGNPAARATTWQFVKTHWDQVQTKMGLALGGMRMIAGAGNFCDAAARADLEKVAAEHNIPLGSRGVRSALERINNCMELRSAQEERLATWLRSHAAAGAP
jgi:aminopeptidase N/puromycin-sensitive aminopeptidase